MSRQGLTVVMIVRDEQDNLRELLPGVAPAADEIVVVDTGSTDGTVAVAEEGGARVVHRPWDDDFSAARNRGLEEVRTSHAMWLDADDRITAAGLRTIREAALRRGQVGLALRLESLGADSRPGAVCDQLRVFPARPEHRFERRIHEQIAPSLARTGTPIEPLDVVVRHLGYATPEAHAAKSRRNLDLCRREWEDGERGIASAYHYVKAAAICGEREEAARIAREVVAAFDGDAGAEDIVQNLRVTLGKLELELGRLEAGEAMYREAVRRVPADPFARLHLGELFRLTGRFPAAVRHLKVALESPPHGTRVPVPLEGIRRAAAQELAAAYRGLGDPDAAEAVRVP